MAREIFRVLQQAIVPQYLSPLLLPLHPLIQQEA
jgi:hypothetical protein